MIHHPEVYLAAVALLKFLNTLAKIALHIVRAKLPLKN